MDHDLLVNSMVLVCLLFWGAWGIFDKKALCITSPLGQLAAIYCFSPLFALVLMAGMTVAAPGWHLTAHTLFWQSLCSLAYLIGTIGYLVAMSRKDASTILGATAIYPVVGQLFAYILLGEPLVTARLIGGCLVVAGVLALSEIAPPKWKGSRQTSNLVKKLDQELDASSPIGFEMETSKTSVATLVRPVQIAKNSTELVEKSGDRLGVFITLAGISLAIIGWALRGIFDKVSLGSAGAFEVNLGKLVCDTVIGAGLLGWIKWRKTGIDFSKARLWGFAFGSALCLAGGSAAYYIALSKVSASYVVSITGCYPLIMYVLAISVLKERFNLSRVVGICLITIGGIVTQTTQNL
jgi:uncharacterized membrane protein